MGRGRLLTAVWTVLFLAASAWLGAWLFGGESVSAPEKGPERGNNIRLSGIALRYEKTVTFRSTPASVPRDGERVPGNGTVACFADGSAIAADSSCVYFSGCDGYEHLSPESAEDLTVRSLEKLLNEPAEPVADARLVTDFVWAYAALAEDSDRLPLEGRCTLAFDGMSGTADAEIIRVSPRENGKRAIVFRLTAGQEYLELRRCGCEIVG